MPEGNVFFGGEAVVEEPAVVSAVVFMVPAVGSIMEGGSLDRRLFGIVTTRLWDCDHESRTKSRLVRMKNQGYITLHYTR